MLVKIIFHGALKRICPKEYEVNADTPVEAIRGLTNQFRDKLFRKDGKRFICRVAECPDAIGLSSGIRSSELNIYPIFSASGGGNSSPWTMIAVGAIILTAAVFLGPGAFGLAGLGWFGSTTSSIIGGIGLSIMLSGVSLLLAPSKINSLVRVEATLVNIEKRILTFEVEAFDQDVLVSKMMHQRCIVNVDKFMSKLK